MSFFQWLVRLPKWMQYSLAVGMLLSSSLMAQLGWMWPYGWIIGLVLLWVACFERPSDSEDE